MGMSDPTNSSAPSSEASWRSDDRRKRMTPPAILSEEPHGPLLLGGYLFHSAAEQRCESKVSNRLIEVNRSSFGADPLAAGPGLRLALAP